ncbi:cytochrome P450 [Arthrobacter globiformis NBRC 12137]|uniref:Cytochrome P450 n=1 Tax=Arthrobacter globiformis (strain ATCC 8010 / DSM 20124 / JCM 1332 / NBRC 12137 / NCIMB 8907 / NRRL B-2979 / 168) TaxID=1077972 RepID=H0QK50_ARTG1|nr:cytochrome P450 [Arthrobacter globiformis]GAB13290.1 cytochrome P450 [Arthrobacter globiformis NBRC 12137]
MTTPQTPGFTLADPDLWLNGPAQRELNYLREHQPLSWHTEPSTDWFPEGGRGFWSLVRHEDISAASKDQDTFSSGQGTELIDMPAEMVRTYGGMLNMTGEEHARHRAIVSRIFTPRTLGQLAPQIQEHARKSIARVKELDTFDFMDDLVADFPAQIVCDLMGVPTEDRPELIRLTGIALAGNGTAESYKTMTQIVDYARGLAAKAAAGDVTSDQASLLRKLVEAEVNGQRLTNEEVGIFLALLLTAGIETTATSIGQGFYAMSLYPEQREQWAADFDSIAPKAIEEIVRWVTPVMHFRRTATRDVEMHGQTIRKGDKVLLWYTSGNQDATVFKDAEKLDFFRESEYPHVAFGGGGPHFCLGAQLARLEMSIFFKELFQALPKAQVTGDPVRLHSNFVNGLAHLPCTTGRA